MSRRVGALQVDVDDRIPFALLHVHEHSIAQDSRVVDQNVEPSVGVDRLLNHGSGRIEVGHIRSVGHGLSAVLANLLDHLVGWPRVLALAIPGAPEIVHDDLGAMFCQHQRVLAPDPSPSSSHDRDAIFTE